MLLVLLLLPALALCQSCQPGAIYNSQYNRCYSYFSTLTEFSIAEQNCQGLGGHLVSISNAYENFLVEENAQQSFTIGNITDFWIGGSDLITTGQWTWTDGTNFLYTKWGQGQPAAGGDCVSENLSDGTWKTTACTSAHAYVCASPPVVAATCPPTPTCPPQICPSQPMCTPKPCASHCESEWTYLAPSDSCYKVFYEAKWADAEAYCVEQNSHLASIHSLAENTFVANIAATRLTQDKTDRLTWIGMKYTGSAWAWTDGTPTDYYNWAPKKPDNPSGAQCVQTAQDKSHDGWYENWNNINCNTQMRAYVCKKPPMH